MKINKLVIRNIASIEKADIDFDNDLIDPQTNRPASLFLISGDTGSGKTVILDCITMALFGTTPRVKSVNGVRNNVYRNVDGVEISVNDIVQYTRIGVSSKDPCYSELHFEGNDGLLYISRFSLGRNNRNNYRDPQWSLRIGSGEEICGGRKEEIKRRIVKAIGLSFEQFCRMAMLAQGQFETFLTGKKEEREQILEQLTATDRFSRYGETISRLFRNAKEQKNIAQKQLSSFNELLLEADEIEKLNEDLNNKTEEYNNLRDKADKLGCFVTTIQNILLQQAQIEKLKKEFEDIDSQTKSEEYQNAVKLVSDWDSTVEERRIMTAIIKAENDLKESERNISALKNDFEEYSRDLDIHIGELDKEKKNLETETRDLEKISDLRPVFDNSALIIEKLRSYENDRQLISAKNKELESIMAVEPTLSQEIEKITIENKSVEDNIKANREKTENLIEKRDELNPQSIREVLSKLISEINDLERLKENIQKSEDERAETEKIIEEQMVLSKSLESLKEELIQSNSELQLIEKDFNLASERYNTMHLSVKANFRELRHKLIQDKSSHCPLCGQELKDDFFYSEETFVRILSPLEEEKKNLEKRVSDKRAVSNRLNDRISKATGRSEALSKEAERLKKRDSKLLERVKTEADRLKIHLSDNSVTEIVELVSSKITERDSLMVLIHKADELQKEIDRLLSERRTLDQQRIKVSEALKRIEALFNNNEKQKVSLKKVIGQAELRVTELTKDIDNLIQDFRKDWKDEPLVIADTLRKEADKFNQLMKRLREEKSRLEEKERILNHPIEIRRRIKDEFNIPSPSLSDDIYDSDSLKHSKPIPAEIEKLEYLWTSIYSGLMAFNSQARNSENVIMESNKEFGALSDSRIKDQSLLRILISSESALKRARLLKEDVTSRLTRCQSSIKQSEQNIADLLKTIDIPNVEDLPDLLTLKEQKQVVDKDISILLSRKGEISERLKTDSLNREKTESIRLDLEFKEKTYNLWERVNNHFGGSRFRTLVQSHILKPLLRNANIYLRQITDHYTLTCSSENEQLSIFVLDRYNNNERRSVTVLSGGERFMISLSLSLALSAMNRPDMNVDILFIDEGFGTLDVRSLNMVMNTLKRLPEITTQNGRRVGVISHREELAEQIDVRIELHPEGEGRSGVKICRQ